MARIDGKEELLHGFNVAILAVDGFEQAELTGPREALERAGAQTRLISAKHGKVQGFNHVDKADQFDVNLDFNEADPNDFDAVLLPGGVVNADQLRVIPKAQEFVRGMQAQDKPVAVICHGAWLLVSAGLAKDRTLTSWPSLQDDIRNAGGKWVDQEVVEDGNWISSRKPADIPAFNEKMIAAMSRKVQSSVRGTADERPDVGATS
ncbi:MAG: type 1 glutamine amidotransferase [Herminiimonas sp.]|nr:type 1 glutamine amidotransferase [Herminiimonas sp.]MDB5854625.1 type 1 glutamine amidotransferase [Herminiimonas sp.]